MDLFMLFDAIVAIKDVAQQAAAHTQLEQAEMLKEAFWLSFHK